MSKYEKHSIKRKRPRYYLDNIYKHMRLRVAGKNSFKTSAAGKPILGSKEFKEWSINNPKFLKLFVNYVKNNFQRKFAPSIDRIDNNGGYKIGNMQWLTVSGNSSKRHLIDRYNN